MANETAPLVTLVALGQGGVPQALSLPVQLQNYSSFVPLGGTALSSLPIVASKEIGVLGSVQPSKVPLLACHHFLNSSSDVIYLHGSNFQVDSTFWIRDYIDASLM